MAFSEEIAAELSKLRKSDLVEIIMKKQIPVGITASESLKKYIDEDFAENFHSTSDLTKHNQEKSEGITSCEYELKVAKLELTYAKESNKQLQAMVSDKDLIIKLLSSKHHNIRTYSGQKSDGVAGSTSISDKEGSPEILVEEPSVGGDVGVGNDRALMGGTGN